MVRPRGSLVIAGLLSLPAVASAAPALITGLVVGPDLRPVPNASIAVVDAGCETVTDAVGTFRLTCETTGLRRVRALTGDRQSEQEVELGPDRMVNLNFLLAAPPAPVLFVAIEEPGTLKNSLVTTVAGRSLSLRALGVVMAVAGFVLGFLAMLVVGRGLGLVAQTRALSKAEAADLVFNPGRPIGPDRVQPVAVAGARGASWSLSYSEDDIAAAFAARRYGWIAAALLPPLLVAVAGVGFGLALLVGQPLWMFAAMMLVPLGFLVTPVIIIVRARSRAR